MNLAMDFYPVDMNNRVVKGSGVEWFSRIEIKILTPAGLKSVAVFNWDAKKIFDWFDNNKKNIICDPVPYWCVELSISKSINSIMDREDVDDDCLDDIFVYRMMHDMKFAVRGVALPSILLGNGVDGPEISTCIEGEGIKVGMDFKDLFLSLDEKKNYISENVIDSYFEG